MAGTAAIGWRRTAAVGLMETRIGLDQPLEYTGPKGQGKLFAAFGVIAREPPETRNRSASPLP